MGLWESSEGDIRNVIDEDMERYISEELDRMEAEERRKRARSSSATKTGPLRQVARRIGGVGCCMRALCSRLLSPLRALPAGSSARWQRKNLRQ